MDRWMDGWMGGWMDGWMDVDGSMKIKEIEYVNNYNRNNNNNFLL